MGNLNLYYLLTVYEFNLYQMLIGTASKAIATVKNVQDTKIVRNFTETTQDNADRAENDATASADTALAVDDMTDLADNLNAPLDSVWTTKCKPAYTALKMSMGSNTAKIVFNKIIRFLKQTKVVFGMGLLLCPQELPDQPFLLSLVTTVATSVSPFLNLNKLKIPSIPTQYIPQIPAFNSSVIGKSESDKIMVDVNKITDVAKKVAGEKIDYVANYIKTNIENVSVTLALQLPLGIIINSHYVGL
jgi:hypothetical protein